MEYQLLMDQQAVDNIYGHSQLPCLKIILIMQKIILDITVPVLMLSITGHIRFLPSFRITTSVILLILDQAGMKNI